MIFVLVARQFHKTNLATFVPVKHYFHINFMIFVSLARHFHLDLVVFNLPLFGPAILGSVPRNFRFELAIFALISHDFGVDLANFAARAPPFR